MNIKEVFAEKLSKGERVIIPYITAGFPGLEETIELIRVIENAGCGIAEVGVPFSDPMADGPTIQYSSQKALEKGVTLGKTLALLKKNRAKFHIPLVIMGYYNPFYQFGLEKLAREAKEAGVQGFIIPDLPLEEAGEWVKLCRSHEIDTIFLVSPTTSLERAEKIAKLCTGFLYCVSVTGVTGARKEFPPYLKNYLKNLQKITDLPRAVGFGISSPEHIKMLYPHAEGMVVGSALIEVIRKHPRQPQLGEETAKFLGGLVQAAANR